jgi:hypothetical protein
MMSWAMKSVEGPQIGHIPESIREPEVVGKLLVGVQPKRPLRRSGAGTTRARELERYVTYTVNGTYTMEMVFALSRRSASLPRTGEHL